MKTKEQYCDNWMKSKPLVVQRLTEMNEEEAIEYLIEWGVTNKTAQRYILSNIECNSTKT